METPSIPTIRAVKTPHDPMKEGDSFRLGGHIYLVTKDNARGRHMVKHLGVAEDRQKGGES